MRNGVSREFEVNVGVHQGSVLTAQSLAIHRCGFVMEALSNNFKLRFAMRGLLVCRSYDLVLVAEFEEKLQMMIVRWKSGIKAKGL